MPKSRLLRFATCLATLFSLAHCGSENAPTVTAPCAPGDPSCSSASGSGGNSSLSGGGGGTSLGGAHSTGGATTPGGATSPGGSTSIGGNVSSGGSTSTGGNVSPGGSTSTGGNVSPGGSTSTGGNVSPGGSTSGGSATGGNVSPGGGSATGGAPPAGGTDTSGGAAPTGGADATGGNQNVDQNGVGLAKPGDEKSGSREYLNLGEIRLLNNRWGSDELGCSNTSMKVYVKADKSVGWDFNRGVCDTSGYLGASSGEHPDFPEIEFGVHPFGAGSDLATSPDFSSTTLLPIQIKNITTATVQVDNLSISLGGQESWNVTFEFWISERDPLQANPGVYAELMAWWGWNSGRWPCETTVSGSVSSAGKNYSLCHQSDTWADGKWRYFQFRMDGGPSNSYSGNIDVKPFLDYLVNTRGYSADFWVSRFEIGSEFDDNTNGSVSIKNITFEVNSETRSFQFAE